MTTITPFLWFNGQAEEAVNYYASIFGDSIIKDVSRYPDDSQFLPGEVMAISFNLAGQDFTALNGGPQYSFTPAISLAISCQGQKDVDYLWDRLTDGGEPGQCAWLVDRYGLSWQVVPVELMQLMGDSDQEKASRVVQAMLTMSKIDIAQLQAAYDGVQLTL